MPQLVVLGGSPVAQALNTLAPQFHWALKPALSAGDTRQRIVVIATQGQGDLDALKQALCEPRTHIAFVGSSKKFRALADKLEATGLARADIDRIKAPAGLDIGAVTPEEIALSILAELVAVRRNALKSNDG
jgi:xanthine dehydrogenase accessory factor